MRVLVTGGTGVVGRATVTALLQRGHVVRLLSRHARRDADQWAQGVHAFAGNVSDARSIAGAADDCEVVIHMAGIVDEHGDETFERVNVEGTRNIMREAQRARARHFIYLSSLGADSGESAYHRSKRQGEAITRQFEGNWTIVRPGNVYGPGDEQISLLLRLVRTLPVLPVVGSGDYRFQPIWHEDLGEALARVAERDDLAGRELDLAGLEITTQNELIDTFTKLTGRGVTKVKVPEMLASLGLRFASAVGIGVAFNEGQVKMLTEGNEIPQGRENALAGTLGVEPMPLAEGLRRLTEEQDEQLPDSGVGPLRRKRIRVDIEGSMSAESLMRHVRAHFAELMASFIDAQAEPVTDSLIEEDATLTLSLPARGHVQVRVAEVEPRVVTLITLAGHPLSGAVRFLAEPRGKAVRFEVQVFERAASMIDLVMMRTLGDRLQDAAWRELVENVVRVSGGTAPGGIREERESLDADQAEHIEDWVRDFANERKREEAGI